jgi:hypothetical protein
MKKKAMSTPEHHYPNLLLSQEKLTVAQIGTVIGSVQIPIRMQRNTKWITIPSTKYFDPCSTYGCAVVIGIIRYDTVKFWILDMGY